MTWWIMGAGAAAGALADRKNPLRGAALGATAGYTGGASLGAAGAAGAAGTAGAAGATTAATTAGAAGAAGTAGATGGLMAGAGAGAAGAGTAGASGGLLAAEAGAAATTGGASGGLLAGSGAATTTVAPVTTTVAPAITPVAPAATTGMGAYAKPAMAAMTGGSTASSMAGPGEQPQQAQIQQQPAPDLSGLLADQGEIDASRQAEALQRKRQQDEIMQRMMGGQYGR